MARRFQTLPHLRCKRKGQDVHTGSNTKSQKSVVWIMRFPAFRVHPGTWFST